MNTKKIWIACLAMTVASTAALADDSRCAKRTEGETKLEFETNQYVYQLNVADGSAKTDLLKAFAIIANARGFEAQLGWVNVSNKVQTPVFALQFSPEAVPTGEIDAPRDLDAYREEVLSNLEKIAGSKLGCKIKSATAVAGPRPSLGGTN